MLAFLLHKADDTLLGSLLFQKRTDFKVYLPEGDPLIPDYEGKLSIAEGRLQTVEEPLICILESGALPDKRFVRRVLRTVRLHPDFDVYHVNVNGAKAFPRKADVKRIFRLTLEEGVPVPLSTFIFRTAKLREKAVFRSDGALDIIPTVLSCAAERPVRNVWLETLDWKAPLETPAESEKRIREKIECLRWTECFFGDDDYPLSVGDQLALFAGTLARLYPACTVDELKEMMDSFQVSQGTIRKLRASSALKNAIQERQKNL